MTLGLPYLTFTPDEKAVEQLLQSWAWKLPGIWTPVIFSILGDAFLESEAGDVFWLDTGLGDLKHVARDKRAFFAALTTEVSENWLLPQLVGQLRAEGKIPAEGQCYSFRIFPIFSEGKYEAENMILLPAKDHFAWSADLHKQLHNLPDGTNVRVVVATPGDS